MLLDNRVSLVELDARKTAQIKLLVLGDTVK